MIAKLLLTLSALSIFIISNYSKSICQTKSDTSIGSTWQGTLEVGNTKLRVVFHFTKTDSNTLTGTLDSPDQGAMGIPVSSVSLDGDSVTFGINAIGGSVNGKLSTDRSVIDGTWNQMRGALPLTLSRTAEVIEIRRPQASVPLQIGRSGLRKHRARNKTCRNTDVT